MPDPSSGDLPRPEAGGCTAGSLPAHGPAEGLWLTAAAFLPPDLLAASPPAAAGFGQGGVLDQLEPGPALDTFTAETAGGIAGTGVARWAARGEPGNGTHRDGTPTDGHPGDGPTDGRPDSGFTDGRPDSGPTDGRPDSGFTDGGPGAGTPGCDEVTGHGRYSAAELEQLSDDELIGLIRSWHKQVSRAQAGELAAVAELAARRRAEALGAGLRDSPAADAACDEVAAALTVTGRAAQALTDRARGLQNLPLTLAALAAGRIDMPKALILLEGLLGQDPDLAGAVEAQVIGLAGQQTTSQLRRALNRALLSADPAAADRRRQTEEKYARIEQIPEPGGLTGSLTGRYLPVPAAVAAWNRVTALARELRKAGAEGTLDELRVHVYLALLTGQATAAPGQSPGSAGPRADSGTAKGDRIRADRPGSRPAGRGIPDGDTGHGDTGHGNASAREAAGSDPAGGDLAGGDLAGGDLAGVRGSAQVGAGAIGNLPTDRPPPLIPNSDRLAAIGLSPPSALTGTVNLTAPLATVLGFGDSPGELAGFGPVTAHTTRQVAAAALGSAAVRWCMTVTGSDGEPVGHGCARRVRAGPASGGGSAFTVQLRPLAGTGCGHQRESSRYHPPPSLWHLIQIRNQRCTAPGCGMPAARCDGDHTTAFEKGGRTCECNLGPLCRYHHRVKQLEGWHLEQPEPGVFAWTTPAGWKYVTGRASYAG